MSRPARRPARTGATTPDGAGVDETPTGSACPICRKPALQRHRPFCSTRCANVDLFRWLGGSYRIATDEEADPGEPPPRDEET